MTGSYRIAIMLGAVVVLGAGFLIARSASDGNGDSVTSTVVRTVVVTTAGDGTTTRTTTVAPKPAGPPTIVVRGGKPVGGVQDLTFKKGATIAFRVRSDVADEAHLHGYDVSKPVGPGQTTTFRVPADIDGRFELELEQRAQPVAVEWTRFRGHVRAFAVRPRKDGVRRAPNPTCVSAGVPA